MDTHTRQWFREQMRRYRGQKGTYVQLAACLEQMLERICRTVAPGAITEGRAKSESSFADKILIRKRAQYGDQPFAHLRDLAGARAIVYTVDQLEAVCRAIEAADGNGLRIDWKNCVNVRRQLGTQRFSYSGMHYVVELTGEAVFGVKPADHICTTAEDRLFAEIQVCTFLQHVWAAIIHDRVYKTELRPPERLEREINAVAALLESADTAFDRAIHDLDLFENEINIQLSPAELEKQIELWTGVVEQCPANHAAAFELGRRLMAAERWSEACTVLETIRNLPGGEERDQLEHDHRIKLERARAAIRAGRREDGRTLLTQMTHTDGGSIAALVLLGTLDLQEDRLEEARKCLHAAFKRRPDDPAVLVPYLEYLLRSSAQANPGNIDLLQGTLKRAIAHCRMCEDRQVRIPEVHFARGRFYCFLGEAYGSDVHGGGEEINATYAALGAYCMGIAASRSCTPIADELAALERIFKARFPEGSGEDAARHQALCGDPDWECLQLARMLLRVGLTAKAVRHKGELAAGVTGVEQKIRVAGERPSGAEVADLRRELCTLQTAAVHMNGQLAGLRRSLAPLLTVPETHGDGGRSGWRAPVVIVAGGCDPSHGPRLVERYGAMFDAAFRCFSGTVIGGGTTAGVSGMAAKLPDPCGRIVKIGYLPPQVSLPAGDQAAPEYHLRRTFVGATGAAGRPYSPAGPIQLWADLLVEPEFLPQQVRLLGIDGGKIAGFEFRLALAMGARVGVVADSERAVQTLLEDRGWKLPEGVVPLTTDAATWEAFIRGAGEAPGEWAPGALDMAAAFVHEEYRADNAANPRKHDASMLPWDKGLPEDFRDSSRSQVRYARMILAGAGYDVQMAAGDFDRAHPPVPADYSAKIEQMAEREHGRYCAERLATQWRYGPVTDVARKINDSLLPWEALPDRLKEFDRQAVRNYPQWLAQAGMVIVAADAPAKKLSGGAGGGLAGRD